MHKHSDGTWENPATIKVDRNLSLPQLVFDRAARDPRQIIAERRTGVGHWQTVSADEFVRYVEELARGLYGMGVRPGDHVAILAATSYEWAAFDSATLSLGAITVPIYESDSVAQISHILNDAQVVLAITQTTQQADLLSSISAPSLQRTISLDKGAERLVSEAGRDTSPTIVSELRGNVKLADVATIIYTSGTTGIPKGVILTHGNFVDSLMQAYDILPDLINNRKSRTLLFLPVAHVLARFVMYAILIGEGRLGFCPDTRTLVHDIETFKPTMMLAVPRVLEKVYNTASAKAGKGIKSTLFSWSANQARRHSQMTAYPDDSAFAPAGDTKQAATARRIQLQVAESLVLRKIKKVLGPNLHTIICGGAPLSHDLAHFYRGLGVILLQGYGLSETTGPITVERPTDYPPDTVGYLWPGNSMKIAPDGELLLKGFSITKGYHNLPEETAEAFQDGWFNTGDLGSIDDEGRLRITGRKKELIVTAGGKNVSPEILEDSLSSHPLISHVVVVGDARPYIAALVTLDPEMLPLWLRNKGLSAVSPAKAAGFKEVRESLEKAITKANQHVSRAESIRRYRIINTEFTVENGYLTPSLKLKRHKVLNNYQSEINAIYQLSEAELAASGGSIAVPESGNGALPVGQQLREEVASLHHEIEVLHEESLALKHTAQTLSDVEVHQKEKKTGTDSD